MRDSGTKTSDTASENFSLKRQFLKEIGVMTWWMERVFLEISAMRTKAFGRTICVRRKIISSFINTWISPSRVKIIRTCELFTQTSKFKESWILAAMTPTNKFKLHRLFTSLHLWNFWALHLVTKKSGVWARDQSSHLEENRSNSDQGTPWFQD